jgi:hypothetical protein
MKKILLVILLLISTFSHAQQINCSTESYDENYLNLLKQLYQSSKDYNTSNRAVREIAINMILIQYQDGTIISPQGAMQVVEEANVIFASANLHFNLCNISMAPYPYAQFPFFNEGFDYAVESQIAASHYLPGYLNIYYARNVTQNATLPNSYPIGNGPRIVTSQAGILILAHELGHFFSLIHTHVQNFYNPIPSTDELVNGSNCATAGDYICDTPADPGLYYFRIAPAPACQYIDTVTTDINGDLYSPILNNFMSTLSWCTNDFTTEQFSRMAYIADHHRAYLKTGSMNFTIDTIPSQVCITDSFIHLSSPNPGGIFSGNGVIGNAFYPALAGPGNHIISYTMPSNSNLSETSDAFFFYIDSLYHSNSVWQSFQIENDGILTGFTFGVQSNTNQNITFKIYNGNGTGGSILEQGSIQMNANTSWDWIKAPLSNLNVVAGNFYTVEFNFADSVNIIGSSSNFYIAGESNFNNDIDFISYIIPNNANCSNTYKVNVLVTEPTTIYSDHIFDTYCASSPISIPEFEPAGGIITIDNVINNTIDPSALNAGEHVVTYTYDNTLGCISIVNDTFEIAPTATIDIANNSVFCLSDSGFFVNTNPNNGFLYLDGNLMTNNFIDLPNYAAGNHILSFAINGNNYDWNEIDQQNYNSQNTGAFSINGSGQYWQSFTADKNGFLTEIKLAINSPVNMNASYMIYKGEGIYSFPIFTGNTNFGGQGFLYNSFDFPDSLIEMKQDSIYTFQVSFQGTVFSEVLGDYSNNYTRGKNNYSNGSNQSDFWFKTYVKPHGLSCLSDSVITNFEITPSLNVNLGADTILSPTQSITLNAGNIGNNYLWSTGDTTQSITVSAGTGPAGIWVQVTSSSGCIASDTINIDIVTSITKSISEIEFKIWPNPIANTFEVFTNKEFERVEIFDMLGQTVMAKNAPVNQKNMIINAENLCAGIYTVCIIYPNKLVYQKVLKK